jgi:hypothetical protein
MSGERQLSRPVDAYKAIIDQLVAETSYGVSEKLVSHEGIFSRARADEGFNSFVQSLSTEQRATLGKILHAERTSAIHDVLAVLSWWVSVGDLGFTFRGESMPVDLSGMGLHGDYVGRRYDWEWPNDEGPRTATGD